MQGGAAPQVPVRARLDKNFTGRWSGLGVKDRKIGLREIPILLSVIYFYWAG
jgi:arginine decarboxylase-like protein